MSYAEPMSRHASASEPAPGPLAEAPLTIRRAVPADAPAIARLAALDSARAPEGEVLVAEVGGEIVAALDVDEGRAVADPFKPTADVVRLLELRAASLRDGRAGAGRDRRGRGLGVLRPQPR